LATYIIGDVHGRYHTLLSLLDAIKWQPLDRVIFVGDLVNVGEDSLGVVRWARDNRAECVLGNHDLHMLAVMAGHGRIRPKDTFQDIFAAEDRDEIFDWFLQKPLVIRLDDTPYLIVHASLLPDFSPDLALSLSGEIQTALREDHHSLFQNMYGNEPSAWSPELQGHDRLRIAINAFTRGRILRDDGALDFEYKGTYDAIPDGHRAWFDLYPHPVIPIFGHWSALGCRRFDRAIALDSGAAWNRTLTAFCVDSNQFTSVPVVP